jgi:oligopeptide/dipeptide ABC transporter ATP-binding protein
MNPTTDTVLSVHDLHTHFFTFDGVVKALSGVSFNIVQGQSLGLVGETGCGKSVTAYSILRLIQPPGKIMSGKILFKGSDLLEKTEGEMREIRGSRISMIFQEPMTSLNPVFTVGDQLATVLMQHRKMRKKDTVQHAVESLRKVKIPDADKLVKQYPHELSGGMRQRVLIAMALSLSPELIICDEPTTFLDATVQAQILKLIKDLQKSLGASMLLITHNLGVVAHNCERVAVMYAGMIVEIADVRTIFETPKHPYVQGLLRAIPITTRKAEKLESIAGTVPNLINPPSGCRFHPRCRHVMPVCREKMPQLREVGRGCSVACYLYETRGEKS